MRLFKQYKLSCYGWIMIMYELDNYVIVYWEDGLVGKLSKKEFTVILKAQGYRLENEGW